MISFKLFFTEVRILSWPTKPGYHNFLQVFFVTNVNPKYNTWLSDQTMCSIYEFFISAPHTSNLEVFWIVYLPQWHGFPFLTPGIHLIDWSMNPCMLSTCHLVNTILFSLMEFTASWDKALSNFLIKKCAGKMEIQAFGEQ